MNTNTALQVTTYDFYGDELVALRDNATGEVYASINSVLKGIGFTDKNQIRKRRDKWINDSVVSKGIAIFKLSTSSQNQLEEGVPKKDTPFNCQDVYCVSQRKLPIALAKISITPTMKKDQPELASKLELYQDKCADVLASVFIDKKTPDDLNLQSMYQTMLQPLSDSIATLTNSMAALTDCVTSMSKELDELKKKVDTKPYAKKKYSYWTSKMFPKYQLLTDYFGISYTELYKNLFNELKNTYPDVDLNQAIDDFCYENRIDSCYTLDVIEHNVTLRKLFESIVDETLTKYNLLEENNLSRIPTIFDQSIKVS